MWEWGSFLVGLLAGILVLLLLVWVAYATRTWVFTYCPRTMNWCTGADYLADPGLALATGAKVQDILFVDEKGVLNYRRQPRALNCTPSFDQEVPVPRPQYCLFVDVDGNSHLARQVQDDAYTTAEGLLISAPADCRPEESSGAAMLSGEPVVRWDAETCYR